MSRGPDTQLKPFTFRVHLQLDLWLGGQYELIECMYESNKLALCVLSLCSIFDATYSFVVLLLVGLLDTKDLSAEMKPGMKSKRIV